MIIRVFGPAIRTSNDRTKQRFYEDFTPPELINRRIPALKFQIQHLSLAKRNKKPNPRPKPPYALIT